MTVEDELDKIDRADSGWSDEQLRHMALDFALRTKQSSVEGADPIVTAAQKYLAFLKGGAAK